MSADISDAVHEVDGTLGNPHFWLLPPVVKQPSIPDKFNRRLSPRVRITEMQPEPSDPSCTEGEFIAYFTTTEGPGGVVVMDAANSQYSVLWQTKMFPSVTAPCVYRLAVELAGDIGHPGLELGFGDVQMLSSASMKSLVTDEFIPLPEDRSFPFRFFIGPGAAFYARTGDDACRPARDCGEAVLDPNQDNVVLTEDQRAGIFVPDAALNEEIVLLIEERTDRPCFSRNLPQVDDCYRFEAIRTAPDDDVGGGDFVITQEGERNTSFTFGDGDAATLEDNYTIGICVEVGDLTPEEAELLQIYRFEPETGELQTLDDVSAPFLPCDPNFAPGGSLGSRNLLQRGWQLVRSGLRALLGPRVLYASSAVIDVGLGGSGDELSYFTWGPQGQLTKVSQDPQEAGPGSLVDFPPEVQVTDFGSEPGPIANVRVVFQITAGGGSIELPGPDGPISAGTMATVRTGPDGKARIAGWRLGPTAGATNTLTASIFGGIGSRTVTFTATAVAADLVITSLTHSPAGPTDADLVEFTVDVTNIGTAPAAGPFQVDIEAFRDNDGALTHLGTTTLLAVGTGASLGAGETVTLFSRARRPAGTYVHKALADSRAQVPESNETNNRDPSTDDTYTVTAVIYSGLVADPTGDAGEGEPDLVSGSATVSRGNLTLRVDFAPGTRTSTARATFHLDVDRSPATGFPGVDAANSDRAVMGVEYLIQMGSAFVGPTLRIVHFDGTSFSDVPNSIPITFFTDAMEATIPLDVLLGNRDGKLNYKVNLQRQISDVGFTGIFDYMPNVGVAPGTVGPPTP